MVSIDAKFLQYIILVLKTLLNIITSKDDDYLPGEKQYKISIAERTVKQLEYIVKESTKQESEEYIRRGLVREAEW